MPQRLVVVYTTSGPGEATIIQSVLEAAGIPCELSREGAGAAYGLTVGPLGVVDILVAEDQAEAAQALLAAMDRGELADDSDAGD
jgi:Putative prokaryotic signal transducing protein